jgi:hypothetical protein
VVVLVLVLLLLPISTEAQAVVFPRLQQMLQAQLLLWPVVLVVMERPESKQRLGLLQPLITFQAEQVVAVATTLQALQVVPVVLVVGQGAPGVAVARQITDLAQVLVVMAPMVTLQSSLISKNEHNH